MNIGILTFHWATNYGAVLQAYSLQEYFRTKGHNVEIINYKPRKYDFWVRYLHRPWLLKNIYKDIIAKRKENKLAFFRKKYLNLTKRLYSSEDMLKEDFNYQLVVSGSDQILNPYFTLLGEDRPTSAYYLESFRDSFRIGYAVSFGCDEYPEKALFFSKKWINNFDKVGVREDTGVSVLVQMDYFKEASIVPDPTILLGIGLFRDLKIKKPKAENYYCVYLLRKHVKIQYKDVIYIDDYNSPLSMEQWIGTIVGSKALITNSYHGAIVAILNHVPFVVYADSDSMNQRFVSLLSKIQLVDRMVDDINEFPLVLKRTIDWEETDKLLSDFRSKGVDFLDVKL